ncbi:MULTISPECIES: peptidase [unclassified Sedimentibacter]|uniref:peptidase n=1 Tax=unclassified Sedimentibacter TaxID=2649220 RepID=UPI0027DFC528|nr:peptidase [Sedimentibacter sp. MB35-C1]WMJ76895.1 peptidase [Sedimentibacter sp. MB35-C1]
MKQILSLILTAMLLLVMPAPYALGAILSDDLDDTIHISVQVTAPVLTVTPAAITLTGFDEPDRTDAVAFAVGTSQNELSDWFSDSVTGFTGYDADGNPYDLISGEWYLDAVDTDTVGVYYASTAPDLGAEYILTDGVSLPRQLCAVSIQAPGEPDINCCVVGRGFLHFPWVLSLEQDEQLDEFVVWLRQNEGEWTSLGDGFSFTSGDFQLSQRILTYGSTYELKVTYPGGQTSVLSFQYEGELSILDYSGGDRDGGDVKGSDSGTGTQPAPTIPQMPVDSPEDDNSDNSNKGSVKDNSSSKEKETLPNSDSHLQEEHGYSFGESQPSLTAPKTPDSSQNNENYNSNNTSLVQSAVVKKSEAEAPGTPSGSAVSIYSDTSLSHEAEGASSPELFNYSVSQSNGSDKAVIKQVPNDNNMPPENHSKAQVFATVAESYSPNKTVISGLRLRDLCADGESVVFGAGNLTVSIPSDLLIALNLSDSDTISVKLTQPESNQIMLSVETSGKLVTNLTGTVLRLQYIPQSENADITVQNETGEQITNVFYDGELLRFAADVTGTYTIIEPSNTQEAQKDMSPLLPMSGGLILAAGGIIFFRRKRHG